MGMDVYGLNPKINHKVDIPPAPWDMKYKTPYKELSEEEQKERTEVTDKYFDACRENEEKNKGVYFRNNVWWWRPLWGYVNVVCDCLTDKDFIGGTDNSGYKISKTKSLKISKVLEEELKSSRTKKFEEDYNEELKNLPLEECDICDGTGKRNNEFVKGTCNSCDGKGEKESWDTNYPFGEENVREFLAFCKESGGFKIC